ncbi:MAG TPA: LysR family transcriptional regulator [Hyphomicrobiales bacterium]|nr:LysR family transcriptional regulator [Hyphomicrobiales bacterium]
MHLKELDANLIVVLDALLIDGSVTRAADRLGRSPSAVSHALANLREILGDDLFVRAGQRLVATSKAEEIAPLVHVIVAGMESLLRPSLPFDASRQERRFVLCGREELEFDWLQTVPARLRAEAPGISMHWQLPLAGDSAYEELRAGRIDFILTEERDDHAADFCWQHLLDDPLTTLADADVAAAHPLTDLRSFGAAPQVAARILGRAGDPVQAVLDTAGVERNVVARATSVFAGAFFALEAGAMITLPSRLAGAVAAQTRLQPLATPLPDLAAPLHLVWHKSRDRDECHEWMRTLIVETIVNHDRT